MGRIESPFELRGLAHRIGTAARANAQGVDAAVEGKAEDGGTRFDYCNEFALPGGALGKAAGGLLSAAPGGREARRSLERLRTLVEGSHNGGG